MDEPRAELTADADADERATPPAFDELTPVDEVVRGERTRDDFLDAVLDADDPMTVGEVADAAGHGTDAAREYLEWFERMGIVTRVTDSPATYRRNPSYLRWRRVQTLRERYTDEELVDLLGTERERAETYAAEFDADSPDEVAITDRASDDGRSVEDVWADVSAWRTSRRRIDLLERALKAEGEGSAGRRRAV
ncbi:DUF7342 family protein [Halobaculum magnesiiphilum]|uniref:Sugar-specific transcriptional regulator TrmB n=1 Tax=Halobaculum magnesiiphilum TaxID=1017351 RepID=A0A8T8WIP4_9EURY|nr:hypothetical protein [Halobaculum magnesiiphilum]QZP39666.1 hypothetical protein K6T50_16915 [Halobaculum magnesiiphilum]